MNLEYKNKYLKYKAKYLRLRKIIGGATGCKFDSICTSEYLYTNFDFEHYYNDIDNKNKTTYKLKYKIDNDVISNFEHVEDVISNIQESKSYIILHCVTDTNEQKKYKYKITRKTSTNCYFNDNKMVFKDIIVKVDDNEISKGDVYYKQYFGYVNDVYNGNIISTSISTLPKQEKVLLFEINSTDYNSILTNKLYIINDQYKEPNIKTNIDTTYGLDEYNVTAYEKK
jgi:hypothetical protein